MNQVKSKSPWMQRIAYGSGDAACNIVIGMLSTILTLFYTDYVGISAAVIGIVMLASRVLDAIGTLLVGFLANKTRSKWGKYRPWILWSSVPYALCIVLLFTVPQTTPLLQGIYIFITYNLCTTVCYNLINVPYGSLGYAMTRDSQERDMLSTIRMAFASAGRLLAVCATLPLVQLWGDGQDAWVKSSIIWAVIAVVMLIFCFVKCKEAPAEEVSETATMPMGQQLKMVLGNGYFWAGAAFQTLQYVMLAVVGTILPYYCKYILNNDSWLYSTMYLVEMLLMISVMLLTPLMVRRYGKRLVCLAGFGLVVIGHIACFIWPESIPAIFVGGIIRGIGYAPFNAVFFSFLGEAVEYGAWKNGHRQESLMYATSTMLNKISAGVSSYLLTGLLAVAGYISTTSGVTSPVQPQSAIDMIVYIYQYGPIIVLGLTAAVLWVYKLEKKLPQMMAEMESRK